MYLSITSRQISSFYLVLSHPAAPPITCAKNLGFIFNFSPSPSTFSHEADSYLFISQTHPLLPYVLPPSPTKLPPHGIRPWPLATRSPLHNRSALSVKKAWLYHPAALRHLVTLHCSQLITGLAYKPFISWLLTTNPSCLSWFLLKDGLLSPHWISVYVFPELRDLSQPLFLNHSTCCTGTSS